MTPDPFAYDPEKALWKPNRRGFLSLFGCAVAAAFVPSLPVEPVWVDACIPRTLITSDLVTKAVALGYKNEIRFMKHIHRGYSDQFGRSDGGTVLVRMPVRFNSKGEING